VSFDALAPWYRTLEWVTFGDDLQRCRIACLGEIADPCRALIIGEGNGRFLCELLRLHPRVEVDCIDVSQRMLQLARKRVEEELGARGKRVHFLHRDITSWSPPEHPYDLVVTHFFLDCFAEIELVAIIRKLAHATTEEASWLFADFCVPSKAMARIRARIRLAVMYRFFRLTAGIGAGQLIDPTAIIRAEGFALVRQHKFRHGMLTSELWKLGSNSVARGR
jgi:ubiquinone/menaquinone biosynthesis C-methylase UbiE